ncbi:hypothetical protein [Streptomyces umbrinus]|uniref:hypothetical protein n=1 Tax=Streptomyces umbrinus TaxID=67370 RepID=UPI0033D88882
MEAGHASLAGQPAGVRVLLKRTPVPQLSRAVVMHQWHRGRPPLPYLWVLRWQPEQGPTRLLEQVKVDGSGSLIGGGKVLVIVDNLFWGRAGAVQ